MSPDAELLVIFGVLHLVALALGGGLLLSSMAQLPGAWYLPSLAAGAIPAALAQHWFNRYLEFNERQDVVVRHAFNGYEMFAIIVGACIIGLIGAGIMMGVPSH